LFSPEEAPQGFAGFGDRMGQGTDRWPVDGDEAETLMEIIEEDAHVAEANEPEGALKLCGQELVKPGQQTQTSVTSAAGPEQGETFPKETDEINGAFFVSPRQVSAASQGKRGQVIGEFP